MYGLNSAFMEQDGVCSQFPYLKQAFPNEVILNPFLSIPGGFLTFKQMFSQSKIIRCSSLTPSCSFLPVPSQPHPCPLLLHTLWPPPDPAIETALSSQASKQAVSGSAFLLGKHHVAIRKKRGRNGKAS